MRNQIAWARFYLAKAGLLGASRRGVWNLTPAGHAAKLDAEGVLVLFKQAQRQFSRKGAGAADAADAVDANPTESETEEEEPEAEAHDYKVELLAVLRALPPAGFERVCQRLLRESGFQQVVVTGKSNDGGIDGHGVLEVNPLVTFKVLFQCKRYGSVAASRRARCGTSAAPCRVEPTRGSS